MNDQTPIDAAGGCPVHQPGGVRALLGRTKLKAGVTVFIAVKTARHTMEWLERFHAAVHDLPEIVEIVDFIRRDTRRPLCLPEG